MGSNYYSFLNCTVYKARTSRNNFRPPPLRSSSTRLRSFSILRRVSTAGILFLHAIAHAGNRGGIHPFAGFKTIRRRFVGSDWFYPILFAKATSTSTRSTSPLTSIISYGFLSLSLSLWQRLLRLLSGTRKRRQTSFDREMVEEDRTNHASAWYCFVLFFATFQDRKISRYFFEKKFFVRSSFRIVI